MERYYKTIRDSKTGLKIKALIDKADEFGRFLPYAQPYRDLNNPHQIIPQWQKDLAGWVDKKWIFRSCEFKDFIPRKGFKCSEYFFNQL